MIFVDSNVIIDLLERDEHWFDWSRRQVSLAVGQGHTLIISAIVVAECAGRFADLADLTNTLNMLDIGVADLPLGAAFAAGCLFRQYRREQTDRRKILADFLIGAHAAYDGATLLTRDPHLYRRYFPELPLITPETAA